MNEAFIVVPICRIFEFLDFAILHVVLIDGEFLDNDIRRNLTLHLGSSVSRFRAAIRFMDYDETIGHLSEPAVRVPAC